MKLTKQITDIGPKARKWEYSQTQIDTDKLAQVRLAVYDNSPNEKHIYEKKRYRCELQLWNGYTTKADYKLFNHFSNYKTFKNNKWKPDNDPYKDWYEKCVDQARSLNEEYGSDAVVLHACLGMPKTHSGRDDGSYGFYSQPMYAAHLLINDDAAVVKLQIENYNFDIHLENVMEIEAGSGAIQYYEKFDVNQ